MFVMPTMTDVNFCSRANKLYSINIIIDDISIDIKKYLSVPRRVWKDLARGTNTILYLQSIAKEITICIKTYGKDDLLLCVIGKKEQVVLNLKKEDMSMVFKAIFKRVKDLY
jgi:hypothetical protein